MKNGGDRQSKEFSGVESKHLKEVENVENTQ